MLVFTRKEQDAVVIEVEGQQEPIVIKLVEAGSRVRLGIDAPAGCKVWRSEIYPTVLSNRQAASAAPIDLSQLPQRLPQRDFGK